MTHISRRAFLGGATLLGLAGCSNAIDEYAQPDLPDTLKPPSGENRHPIGHLLNRAAYGARPAQIEEVENIGREAWLEQQLDYTTLNDDKLNLRLRRLDTLQMNTSDLLDFNGGDNRRYVTDELAAATLLRAVYSEWQLYEVMVGFWSDHFSIYHFKGDVTLLKTADDREVIRAHALGKFGDLLRASAHSPAMLFYLDNILNEKSHPNENYAREIMELHTLGVDGGYTEQDIQEVARCFTGWGINRQGKFTFREDWHDWGEKTVLGEVIPAEGRESDGERVLEILIHHPSTARYVCTKLVRRLVADDPPPNLVADCVTTWQATEGDIRAILRTIFSHSEFEAAPFKLKRPFELLVSLLRATNAQYHGKAEIIYLLDRLGHRPFGWTTPDGYPDTMKEWSGNLVGRWNLCLAAFKNELPDIRIDLDALIQAGGISKNNQDELLNFFGRLLLNRSLTPDEFTTLQTFATTVLDNRDVLGLLAGMPAFQWR